MIDFDDVKTIPKNVATTITAHLDNIPERNKNDIRCKYEEFSYNITCATEDYLKKKCVGGLYDQLNQLLHGEKLICYHAARYSNPDKIKEQGLLANSWDNYKEIMIAELTNLSISPKDVENAMRLIEREWNRKIGSNRSNVCFFSGMSLLGLDSDCASYDKYCKNVGGELASRALENEMPKVMEKLSHTGECVVVKFTVPFYQIPSCTAELILYSIINHYAAQRILNVDCPVQYDSFVYDNVPPEDILEIIPVDIGDKYQGDK